MSIADLKNTHPTGKTTGTAQRAGTEHAGETLTFDLPAEFARLMSEDIWQRAGRNSRTLVKEENLRVVAIAMSAGNQISEHHAAARLSVQVLSGHLQMQVAGHDLSLSAGNMLVLGCAVGYDIQATETSSLLLTVAWIGHDGKQGH